MTNKRKYENRKKNLIQYYDAFFQKLKRKHPQIATNKPGIVFNNYVLLVDEKEAPELEGVGDKRGSNFLIDGIFRENKNQISIYGVTRYTLQYLKQSIRHEALHGFLFNAGKEWGDESELFLLMATIYKARPYGYLIKEGERDEKGRCGEAGKTSYRT